MEIVLQSEQNYTYMYYKYAIYVNCIHRAASSQEINQFIWWYHYV